MYDIISIGGGTYDLFVKAHGSRILQIRSQAEEQADLLLPYGGKLPIEEVHETLGGGAHNTSVAFARMGLHSAYCGLIGNDLWGKKILANLASENVSADLLSTTDDDKTGFSVILNSFEGERTVLNYVGANTLFTAEYFPLKKLMETRWLFLNHLSGAANRLIQKMELILKQNPQIQFAWNPGGEQLSAGAEKLKNLLARTQALFLNKEEAEQFTGLKASGQITEIQEIGGEKVVNKIYRLENIFQKLYQCGAQIVVITDGRRGAQVSDGQKIYYCPIAPSERVDTLGAGDAFASGFTGALILQKNLPTALKFGTLNAASVVSAYGAQKGLLNLKELNAALIKTALKPILL